MNFLDFIVQPKEFVNKFNAQPAKVPKTGVQQSAERKAQEAEEVPEIIPQSWVMPTQTVGEAMAKKPPVPKEINTVPVVKTPISPYAAFIQRQLGKYND